MNTPLKPALPLQKATEAELEEFEHLNINYRSAVGALNYIRINTEPDITFAISHLSQFLKKPGLPHWEACLNSQPSLTPPSKLNTKHYLTPPKKLYGFNNNSAPPSLLNGNEGEIDLAHFNSNHNSFKTKHMDIKYHLICDLLKNTQLLLRHISTHQMAADFLTKSVGKTNLLRSRNFLNLSASPQLSQGGLSTFQNQLSRTSQADPQPDRSADQDNFQQLPPTPGLSI
ncbi:hypothetical protein O181_031271 [Austropuccinia psidii MF-1]|uniref:Reverse transcriptase Ty1/copia-type domain-containing protein n=1 Tax=Austropuccinia psidii MF-1 TaxID=1389203 RepID=A0A9Q3D054_9BASI|nr:hypothetical protein [Austropuccinia psidii MF-1]